MGVIDNWWNSLWKTQEPKNKYNKQTYAMINGQGAQYDYDNRTYLEKGYGMNPDVYAVIQQMTDKAASVPYTIKKIKENDTYQKYLNLKLATKGNFTIQQEFKAAKLKAEGLDQELPMPLKKPNPLQTWSDILKLDKIYLRTVGNAYWFLQSPKDGVNKGQPSLVYSLPAHLMKIVLKKDADLLDGESPISHYMLIDGLSYIEFPAEDVIHFKYPNPFYDLNGSHLYGLSPMKAALRNLESSNDALDHNVKTMKNSGVFGFIHAKDTPFTSEQALQIKEKLVEMDSSPERLSKIAGSSANMEFTRISLSTDELKPHEFLKYDQKTICNVLSWSDKLLNNDDGAKYDNMSQAMKMVVINNLVPDFRIIEEKLNVDFLPRFKGYENTAIEWDISELPEMQPDIAEMMNWMEKAPITENEKRIAIGYIGLDLDGMDKVWINMNKQPIDEASVATDEFDKAFKDDI